MLLTMTVVVGTIAVFLSPRVTARKTLKAGRVVARRNDNRFAEISHIFNLVSL